MLHSGHGLTSAKWNGIIASLHLLAVLLLVRGSSLATTTPRTGCPGAGGHSRERERQEAPTLKELLKW